MRLVRCGVVTLATVIVVAIEAVLIYWIQPEETGLGTLAAWNAFQGGSVFGIGLWSTVWLVVTAVIVIVACRSLGSSRADGWTGFLETVKWLALALGTATVISYMPYATVNLAMWHVHPFEAQSQLAWPPYRWLWLSSFALLALAVLLAIVQRNVRRGR